MVRFRFLIKLGNEDKNLYQVYHKKWNKMLNYLDMVSMKVEDYKKISELGKQLSRDFKYIDVMKSIGDQNGIKLLNDCVPLFDRAPFDLRLFILSAMKIDISSL